MPSAVTQHHDDDAVERAPVKFTANLKAAEYDQLEEVTAEVVRHGIGLRHVVHPVLGIGRDFAGRVRSFPDAAHPHRPLRGDDGGHDRVAVVHAGTSVTSVTSVATANGGVEVPATR